MLNDSAKAKISAALQPLYGDPDFSNVPVDKDFIVTVETSPVPVTPPTNDSEVIDVTR